MTMFAKSSGGRFGDPIQQVALPVSHLDLELFATENQVSGEVLELESFGLSLIDATNVSRPMRRGLEA